MANALEKALAAQPVSEVQPTALEIAQQVRAPSPEEGAPVQQNALEQALSAEFPEAPGFAPDEGPSIYRGGTWKRATERGGAQTQGLYGQFLRELGESTGFAGLVDVGDEYVKKAFLEAVRNPSPFEGLEDLRFGNAGQFVLNAIGEQVYNLGIAAGGAAAATLTFGTTIPGSLTWLTARAALGKGAASTLAKYLPKHALMSKSAAGALGGFGAFLPINTGEIIQEQIDAGLDPDLGSSLILGVPSSALEMVGITSFTAPLFRGFSKEIAEGAIRTILKRFGHASISGLIGEGGTEAAQEALVIASQKLKDPTFDVEAAITSSEGLKRMIFSGVSGAVVGGALGGAGGIARGGVDVLRGRFQTADLDAKTKAAEQQWESAVEPNSFLDIKAARDAVVEAVTPIKEATNQYLNYWKKNLKGATKGTKDAGVAASVEELVKAEQAVAADVEQIESGRATIAQVEARSASVIDAIENILAQMPKVTKNRTQAENAKVESFQKQTLKLLEAVEAAKGEAKAKHIPALIELAKKMTQAGMANANQIKKKYVTDVLKAISKATTAFAAKKNNDLNKYSKELDVLATQLAHIREQFPETTTTAEELQDQDTGADRTESQLQTTRKALYTAIKAVLDGTKRMAFAQGWKELPESLENYAKSENLKAQLTEKGVEIVHQEDDFNAAREAEFPTKKEDLQDAVGVRIEDEGQEVTTEATERTVEAVAGVTSRRGVVPTPGRTAQVEEISAAVSRQATERLEEVEAQQKDIIELRFYDNEGRLLETKYALPEEHQLPEGETSWVDESIKSLQAKYAARGIEGFVISNRDQNHDRLLKSFPPEWKDLSIYHGMYKAIWDVLKKVRKDATPQYPIFQLPPSTVIWRRPKRGRPSVAHALRPYITVQMLRDDRQDSAWIEERLWWTAMKNWDAERVAEVVRQKGMLFEEQNRMFEEQLNDALNGTSGLPAVQLFTKLFDKPYQIWGFAAIKRKDGKIQRHNILTEIEQLDTGEWKTKGGRDAYVFKSKKELKEAITKKNKQGVAQKEKMKRYGDNHTVEYVDAGDGMLVAVQYVRNSKNNPGLDEKVIFDQVAKAIDRGQKQDKTEKVDGKTRKVEDDTRVRMTDPNGTDVLVHLGEITTLGHMQRMGPGHLYLGTQAAEAVANFLFGMGTFLGMGYEIHGLPLSKKTRKGLTSEQNIAQDKIFLERFANKKIWGNMKFAKFWKVRKPVGEMPNYDALPGIGIQTEPRVEKAYGGVGSREAPKNVLKEMKKVAKRLAAEGYTLFTGDAQGSDSAFASGVENKKQKMVFKPQHAKKHPVTRKIAKEVHPKPEAIEKSLDLMARNTYQVFGPNLKTPVDFLLVWTPDGAETWNETSTKTGGTGQAIRLAAGKGIPVINMQREGWQEKLENVLKGIYIPETEETLLGAEEWQPKLRERIGSPLWQVEKAIEESAGFLPKQIVDRLNESLTEEGVRPVDVVEGLIHALVEQSDPEAEIGEDTGPVTGKISSKKQTIKIRKISAKDKQIIKAGGVIENIPANLPVDSKVNTIFTIGDHVVEETGAGFRVRKKTIITTKGRNKEGKVVKRRRTSYPILMELPKTVVTEDDYIYDANTDVAMEEYGPEAGVRARKVPTAVRAALEKAIVLQAYPSREIFSSLVGLYGLDSHALQAALERSVGERKVVKTPAQREAELAGTDEARAEESTVGPSFLDPSTADEALTQDPVEADLNDYEASQTVLSDDTAGTEEFSELAFAERQRTKPFGEDESLDRPFKMRIGEDLSRRTEEAQKGYPKSKDAINPFMKLFFNKHKRINDATMFGSFQVGNLSSGWGKLSSTKLERAVESVLKKLNIKEKIIIFDDESIPTMRAKLEKVANSKQIKNNNPDAVKVAKQQLKRLKQYQNKEYKRGFIGVTRNVSPSNRAVFIYAPRKAGRKYPRGWRLAHELGHLVQYMYIDALPAETQQLMYDALVEGGERNTQEEAFANWMSGEIVRLAPELDSKSRTIAKALLHIRNALKDIWKWAKNTFPHELAGAMNPAMSRKMATFHGFLEALYVHTGLDTSGWKQKVTTDLGRTFLEDLDKHSTSPLLRDITERPNVMQGFDPSVEKAVKKAADPMMQNYWEDMKKFGHRFVENPLDAMKTLLWTADGELRSMGGFGVWLAREFHVRPGEIGVDPKTVLREIMQEGAHWHYLMHRMLKDLPVAGQFEYLKDNAERRWHGGKEKITSEAQQKRHDLLMALQLHTPPNKVRPDLKNDVEAIRKYLNELGLWYRKYTGSDLRFVKDYYPLMLDAIIIDQRRQEFVQILMDNGNFTLKQAEEKRAQITRDSQGGLNTGYQEDLNTNFEFHGPGASFKRERAQPPTGRMVGEAESSQGQWTPEVREELIKAGFYQQDLATTLIAYTDMVVRRAVWEKRYGNHEELSASEKALYKSYGINWKHPIAKLQLKIAQAEAHGHIAPEQYDRIVNDILPAYSGQLGLRTNSKIRRLNAALVIYQNIRLLGFAVFSSVVDMGTVLTRGDMESNYEAFEKMLHKESRDQLYEMLEEIGALRIDLTQHVLNDQALNTFMTGNAKRINDLFFRYNQMERWTNMMRALALASGRRFIIKHAGRALDGNKTSIKYMEELGVRDLTEARDWDGSIGSSTSENLKAALNRFIDEAMIRPDPTIRPVWMSDPAYSALAHLKGFLYGFQATFLHRVFKGAGENIKTAWNDKSLGTLKTVSVSMLHQNLWPLFVLGAAALPFAAIGYAIRRQIAWMGEPEGGPEGWDYIQELIERSGLLGAFQLIVDMEQAHDYGKPYGVGVAGPAVEQLYDFISKGFGGLDYNIARATPIVAQMPPAQRWVRDVLPFD